RVAATALQLGSVAGDFTTLPPVAVDPATAGTQLVFAQFANGSGIVSSIFLMNPLTSPTSGELTFFDDDGSALAISLNGQPAAERIPFSLAAQGTATFTTNGEGPLISGSARVSAATGVGGVLSFSIPGLGIAGVGSSPAMNRFIAPVRRNAPAGLSTGIAITASMLPVTLQLTLRNQGGQRITGGEATLQLAPNGHIARFIQDLFPNANTADFAGTLTVISQSGEVSAMAIELGSRPGEFTTLPVEAVR
ncbi:MAG: hypothetical protein HY646_01900, partial [Acidobacteria bacterium]|nr:hypothetical protein [Acidobacteriota bacterium]